MSQFLNNRFTITKVGDMIGLANDFDHKYQ